MMCPVHAAGPRSPTRHWAVLPLEATIFRIVPNGNRRWAHDPEPAWLSYQVAVPLWYTPLLAVRGACGGTCTPESLVPRRRIWVTGGCTTSSRITAPHWTIWPSLRITL